MVIYQWLLHLQLLMMALIYNGGGIEDSLRAYTKQTDTVWHGFETLALGSKTTIMIGYQAVLLFDRSSYDSMDAQTVNHCN
jgi:hypothetical protein